jgi:hypothetical protein
MNGPGNDGPRHGGLRWRGEPNWGKKEIRALLWLIGGRGGCSGLVTPQFIASEGGGSEF